jgi:hypothetical protein
MSASVPLAKLCDVAELNPRLTASLNDGDAVSFLPMAAIDSELTTAVDREIRSYAEVRKGYAPFLNGDVKIAQANPRTSTDSVRPSFMLSDRTRTRSTLDTLCITCDRKAFAGKARAA